MHPARVLIVSMEYTPKVSGGVGTHAQELARGLAARGCAVTVITYTPGEGGVHPDGAVDVHLLAARMDAERRRSIVGGIRAMNDQFIAYAESLYAARQLPDVIQCYNWVTFRAATALGTRFGVPVVSTIQFVSEPAERWWGQEPDPAMVAEERFLFTHVRHAITVSESMREVIAHTYHVPAERLHVVYNALDPEPFSRRQPPERLDRLRRTIARDGEQVVFFAGRLSPQKGVAALLASAKLVIAEHPSVRYVCAGEADSQSFGPVVADFAASSPAARSQVTFLGKMPRHQLPHLYHAADVAVVPSVYEPFGYAAIEAMAAGTPLIVSRTGGLAEIVEHERTGLHVPVHDTADGRKEVDVPQLAAMQLRLLRDRSLAAALAAEARRAVAERFHRDAMATATLAVYEQARADMPASIAR